MWAYNNSNELRHYGVPGMKWGRRGVDSVGRTMFTRKRQLASDKRDLKRINNGGHTSIGFTKKRQAAYDKRDKAILEKRISTNQQKIARKKELSDDAKTVKQLKQKSVKQLSNAELRKVNERSQLEMQYKNLNPSYVNKGTKYLAGAAALTGTALALYKNSESLIKIGSKFVKK